MQSHQSATHKIAMPAPGERSVVQVNARDVVDLSKLDLAKVRVDLLGADVVLTDPATGATVVLSQIALNLFSDSDAPTLVGAGGQSMTSETLLAQVGKVWEFSALDYLGITSLNQASAMEGQSGGQSKSLSEKVSQVTPAAEMKPLTPMVPMDPPSLKQDARTFDKLLNVQLAEKKGDFNTPPRASVDVPDRPPEDFNGSGNNLTFRFTANFFQPGLTETTTGDPNTNRIDGGGAFETAVFDNSNAAQFSREIIDVSAGNKSGYIIYADNPTSFTDTTATRMLQLQATLPDGFTPTLIRISGLPAGFSITGATDEGGGVWELANPTLQTGNIIKLPLVYPTGADAAFNMTMRMEATFNASADLTTPATGEVFYTLTRPVEIKTVATPADGNFINNDGRLVWVAARNENGNRVLGGDKTIEYYGGKGADEVTTGLGNDILRGGAGNDILSSGGGNDFLQGGAGSDILVGGEGVDTADYSDKTVTVEIDLASLTSGRATATVGGAAEDQLENIENLTGGSGSDTFFGDNLANHLRGGAGNDVLMGRGGNDTLDGEGGIDTVSYAYVTGGTGVTVALSGGAATVVVGSGDTDTLANIENLIGSDFADTLTGDINTNHLRGGLGNDTIFWSEGSDILDGEGGTDTLMLTTSTAGATLDLSTVDGSGYALLTVGSHSQTVRGIENLRGGAFADTLTGDAQNNIIWGGAGSDTLDGAGGSNTLRFDDLAAAVNVTMSGAGAGSAVSGSDTDTFSNFGTIHLSNHADTFTESTAADTVFGGLGDDTFAMVAGDSANDTFDGEGGTNTADYTNATNAINANLAAETVTGNGTDTLRNIQNIVGTALNDTIQGSSASNRLDGGGGTNTLSYAYTSTAVVANLNVTSGGYEVITIGSDTDFVRNFSIITGGGGNDTFTGNGSGQTFNGGNGNDTFNGSLGADTFNGGANTDTVNYTPLANAVTLTLDNSGNGTAAFTGLVKTDTLTSIENVTGSTSDDNITGNSGSNTLRGGNGNDTLRGEGGNDSLFGDDGDDTLYGGEGSDTIDGGAGNDTVYGDGGDDTFIGSGGDDVYDGGTGFNTMNYSAQTGNLVIDLRGGTWAASGGAIGNDTFTNMQRFQGGSGNDFYYGSSGDDNFTGNGGYDRYHASDGNDTFDAESLNYGGYSARLAVDLQNGTIQKDTNNDGTFDFTDTASGSSWRDINTAGFDDVIYGSIHNNGISSGSGNDTLYASRGSDTINGQGGTDTLIYTDLGGSISANLVNGTVSKTVDSSADILTSIEILQGTTGNDTFITNASAFTSYTNINGGAGTDSIVVNSLIGSSTEASAFASRFTSIETFDLRSATLNGGDSFQLNGTDVANLLGASGTLNVLVGAGFNLAVSGASGSTNGNTTTYLYSSGGQNHTLNVIVG